MRSTALAAAVLVACMVQTGAAQAEDPYAYLRIDADRDGVQLWAGGNHPLGGGAYFAGDVIGNLASSIGQADVGFVLPVAGALSLLPSAGLAVDFGDQHAAYLVPRLFTVLELGPLYLESWVRMHLADVFANGAEDTFYTRNFLLCVISRVVAVGPQHELLHAFHNAVGRAVDENALGGRLNLAFGEASVLGLFLGYDFSDEPAGHLAGRFTFVRNF